MSGRRSGEEGEEEVVVVVDSSSPLRTCAKNGKGPSV
jgi:hypothetical protein